MAGFHKVALDLLTNFGFDVLASNTSSSGFDIDLGKNITQIDSQVSGKAVYTQLDTGKLKENGYLFKEGDTKLLINVPLDFDLNVSSLLSIEGVAYKIAFMQEVKDVLETAVYKVVIREDVE